MLSEQPRPSSVSSLKTMAVSARRLHSLLYLLPFRPPVLLTRPKYYKYMPIFPGSISLSRPPKSINKLPSHTLVSYSTMATKDRRLKIGKRIIPTQFKVSPSTIDHNGEWTCSKLTRLVVQVGDEVFSQRAREQAFRCNQELRPPTTHCNLLT